MSAWAILRDMELHETVELNKTITVLRVHHGWIYHTLFGTTVTSVFVPETTHIHGAVGRDYGESGD